MRRGKKIFWGILFILGAVALLIGKLGYLGDIGFWSIFFTLGLLGFLIEGIFKRKFGTILFALAFLVIVNDKFLGLEAITPWPVLGAALLCTIGLNILFPGKYKVSKHIGGTKHLLPEEIIIDVENDADEESEEGEEVRYEVVFGNAMKYVTGKSLSSVRGECVFGDLNIYLDNAELKNHRAEVRAEAVFGNIILYVPASWSVIQDVDTVFGSVDESGCCSPDGVNCIYVWGDVVFGSLIINYV